MSPKLIPVEEEMLILSISSAASSQTLSACDADMRVVWVDEGFFVVWVFSFAFCQLNYPSISQAMKWHRLNVIQ